MKSNSISFEMISRKDCIVIIGLVLILIFPVICNVFICKQESLSHLLSSFLYALPLCFFLNSIRNKWVFSSIMFVLLISSILEIMMVVIYHSYLLTGNVIAIFSTTQQEGSGFILNNLSKGVFILPFLLVWLITLYNFWIRKRSRTPNLLFGVFSLFIASLFIAFQLIITWKGTITTRFYVKQNVFERPPYNFFYQLIEVNDYFLERRYIKEAQDMTFGAYHDSISGKEIYILAIGESLRYDNLSLAGYNRKTTPFLDSQSNVVLYSNYYSTANLTMYSVPQILTRATALDFETNYKEKSIFKPFQECGFKTFALSAKNLLSYESHRYLTEGMDSLFCVQKDSEIPIIVNRLVSTNDKVFIIIQFWGNHGPYNNFDENHNQYKPNLGSDGASWPSHEAMINAYDNTVLNLDGIISRIINSINLKNGCSAFFMVSDHGDSFGPGLMGHGGNCTPSKQEYHVPLFFWCNNNWKESYYNKWENLVKQKDCPVNADNVFYSVCDMADIAISAKFSNQEMSIFNPKLQVHRRFVLVPDGKSYIEVE